MRATFIDHSGFLVELDTVCLLFDWWKGELPPLPDGKPLLAFASHSHDDHFNPEIFKLDAAAWLLGRDIKPRSLARKGVSPEMMARCHILRGGDTVSPMPHVTVEALTSTDLGVAFLVTADGQTVFHAGDLNWWHWAEEPDPWNPEMEVHFKQYAEPLRKRHIDLALLPLDPRLKEDGFRGPKYFLELADIDRFIPMHQWDDFAFTDAFLSRYPQFGAQTMPVTRCGQVFEI